MRKERVRIIKEEIIEAEKLKQPNRLCQLYALLHKEEHRTIAGGGSEE